MNKKNIVLSGVQPTGNLHLGNYLGAIKNFVNLQEDNECLYMLADLHAITVFQDPVVLKKNTLETVAGFLAAGLDSEKSIICKWPRRTGMDPKLCFKNWLVK